MKNTNTNIQIAQKSDSKKINCKRYSELHTFISYISICYINGHFCQTNGLIDEKKARQITAVPVNHLLWQLTMSHYISMPISTQQGAILPKLTLWGNS